MSKKEKTEHSSQSMSFIAAVLMPVFILILCIGIALPFMIRPYEKFSAVANIAFMDSMKPAEGSGLQIVEGDIKTDYSGKTYTDGEVTVPVFGEQYAVLEIKSAGINVPVYWGSNEELLEIGAVQTTSSAAPGAGGNAVIDAHVNTFFHDLDKAKKGDKVVLYTNYGKFTYEVSELINFKADDKKYILPAKEEKLTLYTCEMQVFGSSENRVGVVCKPVEMVYYNPPKSASDGEKEAE